MSLPAAGRPCNRNHRATLGALVLTVAAAVASAALVPLAPSTATPAVAAAKKRAVVTEQPAGATTFRMASFNVLGADHTDGKNPRKGYATSAVRLPLTKRVLENNGVQVVGFQELHWPQAQQWAQIAGDQWDYYPGTSRSEAAAHNSISWRRDSFALVQANVFLIPYFKGNPLPMPYVQLQDLSTGQLAWFVNVHNPADTRGNAAQWRAEAVQREIDLVNSLRATDPTIPVFLTGDMNDTSKFFCPIVRGTELRSASGGWATTSQCAPPTPPKIDWVTGTSDVSFSSFLEQRTALVKKASDHPIMLANATVPPASTRGTGITNVVMISVDGLRPNALTSAAAASRTTAMRSLRETGASTMNARLAYERSTPLPNTLSELTGRPVLKKRAGHGVKYAEDRGRTVHQTAGEYVSSVFDIVHNNGGRTALYTSQASASMLQRTWGANGGQDTTGRDNGRNKLSVFARYPGKDKKAVKRAMADLKRKPATLSYIELGGLEQVGERYRYGGPRYNAALSRLDHQVGAITRTIAKNSATAGHTMVILTGGSRGTKASSGKGSYTAPLVVWGPGVISGANLYDLNPDWHDPGSARRSYSSNPIFTSVVANLALGALGMAPLPRSSVNPRSSFNVFVDGPPVTTPVTP